MRVGELGNLAGGTANAAADVEDLHALLDANLSSQVVLVTSNGLVKGLAGGETAEVEALAPAILVDICREVVVTTRQRAGQLAGSSFTFPLCGTP